MGMYDNLAEEQVKCFGIPCVGFSYSDKDKELSEKQFYCNQMGGNLRWYKKGDVVPYITPYYAYSKNFAIYDFNIFSEEDKCYLCVNVIQDGKFVGSYKPNSRKLKEFKIDYYVDKYGYPFVCDKQSDLLKIVDDLLYNRKKYDELENKYFVELTNGKVKSQKDLFDNEFMDSLPHDEMMELFEKHDEATKKANQFSMDLFRARWIKPKTYVDDEINMGWLLGSIYYAFTQSNYKDFTQEEWNEIYKRVLLRMSKEGLNLDEEVIKYRQWCFANNNTTVDWNLFDDMISNFRKVQGDN